MQGAAAGPTASVVPSSRVPGIQHVRTRRLTAVHLHTGGFGFGCADFRLADLGPRPKAAARVE